MKSTILTTLFIAASFGLQAAKNEPAKAIPKEAFGVFSYEGAKKQSAKKKDPIVFLYINERTEDAKIEEAAKIAYWGLEKDNTIVVLRPSSTGEWKRRLPENMAAAINAKDLGKEYPRLVAMEYTGAVVLKSVAAGAIIDGGEDFVKGLNKELKELNKNPPKADAAPAAPAAAPATPAAPAAAPGTTPAVAPATAPAAAAGSVAIKDAKPENWTNAEGKTIQATLLEVKADTVVLQLANGTKVDYALANFNDVSKKRVEELKASSAR